MLIRLSPEQIVLYWERIRPYFLEYMIPKADKNPETVFNIVQSLMTEKMQLWVGIEKERNSENILDDIYGFLATMIDIDGISGTKNLLIYSMFSVREVPITIWENGIKILEEYKEINKCSKIIAYTEIPGITMLGKRLGFKIQTFMYKE